MRGCRKSLRVTWLLGRSQVHSACRGEWLRQVSNSPAFCHGLALAAKLLEILPHHVEDCFKRDPAFILIAWGPVEETHDIDGMRADDVKAAALARTRLVINIIWRRARPVAQLPEDLVHQRPRPVRRSTPVIDFASLRGRQPVTEVFRREVVPMPVAQHAYQFVAV